ncbi:hypothetical protein BX667DRAFT_500644, partial [Coemansia mojavensis]
MDFPVINLDIIYRIIYWSAKDAGENLKEWKSALPLLGVCSSWRQACLKRLYSNFIIDDTIGDNASLIMDNGYGRLVKRMIVDETWEHITKIIIDIVGATESNCPGVGEFMEGMPECDSGYDECDGFCVCDRYNIIPPMMGVSKTCPNGYFHERIGFLHTQLADMLKEKMPNIISFDLFLNWLPVPDVNIFESILKTYESQITELKYDGPGLRIELESPKLTNITYIYDEGSFENPDEFIIVFPESLYEVIVNDNIFDIVYDEASLDALEIVHFTSITGDEFHERQLITELNKRCPKLKDVYVKP